MRKLIFSIMMAASVLTASALPKALYVKKGDTYTKYNFGVAENLKFSNGGKNLTVKGYSEVIDLDAIDYITFTAPVQTALSPSEQKARMIAIGEEVNKRIDLYNVQDAIKMGECFTRSNESNDWTAYCEYEVPQEYWDVHNEFGKNAIKAAAGDMKALIKAREGAANIYKFEDYTGIYNANSKTRKWERIAKADYFEMRFRADDGDNYVVRLTPSKDFTSYSTTDYKGQLPANIQILLAKGNTTIATGSVKSELKQDQSISFDTEISCGKYTARETMKILNSGITSELTVTVAGEKFVVSNREVTGKNLLVYDEMHDAFHNASHWHDEYGNCMGDDYDALTAHFIRANASVDVLGQLQAKLKGFGANRIYNHFKDMDDYPYSTLKLSNDRLVSSSGKILKANSDNSIIEATCYDEGYYRELEKYYNNYVDASFHYDKKPDLQGYLAFETMEDSWDYEPWYGDDYNHYGFTVIDGNLIEVSRDNYDRNSPWVYAIYNSNWDFIEMVEVPESKVIFPKVIKRFGYDLSPVLVFPDLTSFAFEDFFDETSFKKLIDDYDDIVSTYETILGRDDNRN